MQDHVHFSKEASVFNRSSWSGLTCYACTSHIARTDKARARRALALDFQLTYCKRQRSTRAGILGGRGTEKKKKKTYLDWRMKISFPFKSARTERALATQCCCCTTLLKKKQVKNLKNKWIRAMGQNHCFCAAATESSRCYCVMCNKKMEKRRGLFAVMVCPNDQSQSGCRKD